MGLLKPITVGMKWASDTLSKFFVRNSSASELAIFDTDGYLYQNGTKLTATPAEMNAIKVQTVCARYTTAQINAGVDLVTPTATGKWKVLNVFMRAIGGAATTNTSIDITEETSAAIVFSATQAALTQNTILGVNSTNVTATNLGVESVAGKKLKIANVGTAMTVATHVDVILTFVNSVA
jgi:hypothetical protein